MRRVLLCAATALALLAVPAGAQSPSSARVYRGATPITPGTPVSSGEGVALSCSAAGNERLVMQDGSFLDVAVAAAPSFAIIDNVSIKDVNAAGSTASCIVTVLRVF